jgi:hypothetical protein
MFLLSILFSMKFGILEIKVKIISKLLLLWALPYLCSEQWTQSMLPAWGQKGKGEIKGEKKKKIKQKHVNI